MKRKKYVQPMTFVMPLQCEHICLVNSGTTGGIVPGMPWEESSGNTSATVPSMGWKKGSDWSEYEQP